MSPARARLSVENCHVTPLKAAELGQYLGARLSWHIEVVIHFHSNESLTLTFVPPWEYWQRPAMFKELVARVSGFTTGTVIEQGTEDTVLR